MVPAVAVSQAVFGILLLSLVPHLSCAIPYAGGAGSAIYFNRELPQTIGFQWRDTPRYNMTIEFWARLIDFWQTDQYVFALSTKEFESELSIGFNEKNIYTLKGAARNNIPTPKYPAANMWARKDWWHFALTWGTTGNITVYIDGVNVYSITSLAQGGDFLLPIQQGGCFAFGQEADSPCGAWDRTQSADLIFDEFRVWDYIRSAAQVKDNFRVTVPAKSPGLNLYWKIDDRGSQTLKDDSVSGKNEGSLGNLPDFRNQMSYVTGEVLTAVAPTYVTSSAPMFGAAFVHAYVAAAANTSTLVNLPAWSTLGNSTLVITVLTLPTLGTLAHISGAPISAGSAVISSGQATAGAVGMSRFVKYITPTSKLTTSDSFTFKVADSSGSASSTVIIWPQKPLATPRSKNYTTGEDKWLLMHMHGLTETGEQLRGRVDTLPAKGKIFQAAFSDPAAERYTNIIMDQSKLTRITVPGTLVNNRRGILLFLPDADEFSDRGQVYTTLSYSLVAVDSLGSITDQTPDRGIINIFVTAINDGPAVPALSFSVDAGAASSALTVSFTSTDIDLTFSDGAVYYRVVKPPAFGVIYQMNEDGTRGVMMNTKPLPEIRQYGSYMPSWSTQFTKCDWDLCTWPNTTCPKNCVDHRWWAEKVLGPPDIYPAYLDSGLGWDPQWLDVGVEYVDVGLTNWVYVSKVEVYETQNPGALIRLSVRSRTSNKYTTLWQGKAQALPKIATISAPPVCPIAVQGAVVRVEIDDKAIPGWQTIDTVAVTGTQDAPQGQVLNTKARVFYVPTPGIHSSATTIDSFTYAATDCLTEGAAATVKFNMLPLSTQFTQLSLWRVLRVGVHNSVVSEVLVNLEDTIADILAAAATAGLLVNGDPPQLSNVSIIFKGIESGSASLIYNVDATSARSSLLAAGSTPAKFGTFLVALDQADTASVHAHVWITVATYTWRVKLLVVMLDFVPNLALRYSMAAVAALGVLIALTIMLFVFLQRRHPIILAAQGIFLFPILVGCILSFGLVFALVKPLPSNVDCIAQPWLGAWGFSLAFAPLIAKTYRLSSIFNNKKMRVSMISNKQLFGMTGAIFGILSVWVLVWCIVDPPMPVLFETELTSFVQCATKAGSGSTAGFWSLVLLVMMGLLTVYTAWLSFRVRKVPSQFNESRFIAMIIYNLTFVGLVVVVFCLTFVTNPDVAFALISVGIIVVTFANLALLFLPKIMRISLKSPIEPSNDSTGNTTLFSMRKPIDSGGSANSERATT